MAEPRTYVWKGPLTAVEVWPATGLTEAGPILSQTAATGQTLAAPLDPDHPLVRGWLAFGLIAEAPSPANDAAAARKERGDKTRQETTHG